MEFCQPEKVGTLVKYFIKKLLKGFGYSPSSNN